MVVRQHRPLAPAYIDGQVAPGAEDTALRQVDQVGEAAADYRQRPGRFRDACRVAFQQFPRVWMLWVQEYFARCAALVQAAGYDGVIAAGVEEGGHPLNENVATSILTPRMVEEVESTIAQCHVT